MKYKLIIVLLLIFTNSVFSVYLDNTPSVEQEFEKSQLVLIVEVLSKTNITDEEGFWSHQNYELLILDQLKGNCSKTMNFVDDNDSGRFHMDEGKQYILFIEELGSIDVNPCGNSGLLSERKEILKQIKSLIKTRQSKNKDLPTRAYTILGSASAARAGDA